MAGISGSSATGIAVVASSPQICRAKALASRMWSASISMTIAGRSRFPRAGSVAGQWVIDASLAKAMRSRQNAAFADYSVLRAPVVRGWSTSDSLSRPCGQGAGLVPSRQSYQFGLYDELTAPDFQEKIPGGREVDHDLQAAAQSSQGRVSGRNPVCVSGPALV